LLILELLLLAVTVVDQGGAPHVVQVPPVCKAARFGRPPPQSVTTRPQTLAASRASATEERVASVFVLLYQAASVFELLY
jgi:hypothetical protein